jgi:hypothetical protein
MKPSVQKILAKLNKEKIDLSLKGYTTKVTITDFFRRQRDNASIINEIISKGQKIFNKLNDFELELKSARSVTDKAEMEISKLKNTMKENDIDTSSLNEKEKQIAKDRQQINEMLKVVDLHKKRIRSL